MHWLEAVREYRPYNEQEAKDKELFLHYATRFDDILTRDNELVHVTASACVVNPARDKMLMVHHNIYKSWSWAGGHADGESDLLQVACREVQEETGVKVIRPVIPGVFSLDLLPVLGHYRRGRYVAPHLHLSLAYLLEAAEDQALVVKQDENSAVRWIPLPEIGSCTEEPHMKKVYTKLMEKVKALADG